MRRVIFTLVVGLVLFGIAGAPTPQSVQAATGEQTITASGDADVNVVPDEVVLMLGVETWDKDLAIAKNQNDARVKKVLALTQTFQIESKHVQTDQISVEPRYTDGYTQCDLIGFFVRKSIVVTLKDLTKFEDLLTGVLGAGATHVYNVQYRMTELRRYRDQARALAIRAAQEKAKAMAGELGQKAGKAITIREEYSNWWSSYSWRWGGAQSMSQNVTQNVGGSGASLDNSAIALGQITVNARVTVTFELD
jgi:uncharacterized protein YggE